MNGHTEARLLRPYRGLKPGDTALISNTKLAELEREGMVVRLRPRFEKTKPITAATSLTKEG